MKHEIKRLSGKPAEGGVLAVAALRGQVVQRTALETFELADGTRPDVGCLTRDVIAGGPAVTESIFPGRIELPFTVGQEVSAERADLIEAEGADFLDVSIEAGTAEKTLLTFTGGKLSTVAGGQTAFFMLVKQLPPETEGNVRILAERIQK
jgi:hypothetical protein